jgi:hypothetical protein
MAKMTRTGHIKCIAGCGGQDLPYATGGKNVKGPTTLEKCGSVIQPQYSYEFTQQKENTYECSVAVSRVILKSNHEWIY